MSEPYDDSNSTTAHTLRLIRDEAKRAGYRQAIADLRDEKAFEAWLDSTAGRLGAVSDPYYRDYFVAFLESKIDQPGREEE